MTGEHQNTPAGPVKQKESFNWGTLRIISSFFFLSAVVLAVIGYLLKQQNFSPLVPDYEEGPVRFIQYFLFSVGVGIFFFCDGISTFLARHIFSRVSPTGGQSGTTGKLFSAYFRHTVIMQAMLDLISLTGFAGFLICSNLTWLMVFVLLQLSIQWRFWPTQARLERLLESLQK